MFVFDNGMLNLIQIDVRVVNVVSLVKDNRNLNIDFSDIGVYFVFKIFFRQFNFFFVKVILRVMYLGIDIKFYKRK